MDAREVYDSHHAWSRRYGILLEDLAEMINENNQLKRELQKERSKRVRLENELWMVKNKKRR